MTTRLSLYNGALSILKARRLTTVNDDQPERYALDDEYDKSIQAMLEEGDWNFASRAVIMTAESDVEPDFGPTYAFEKPEDWCRLVSIADNEDQYPQLETYKEEGLYLLAYVDTIYVTYVSNDDEFGLNIARWPQTFVRAVEYDLAQRIAGHITSMSASELKALRMEARDALVNAKTKDARAQANQMPPPGRLVQARLGRGWRGDRVFWRR